MANLFRPHYSGYEAVIHEPGGGEVPNCYEYPHKSGGKSTQVEQDKGGEIRRNKEEGNYRSDETQRTQYSTVGQVQIHKPGSTAELLIEDNINNRSGKTGVHQFFVLASLLAFTPSRVQSGSFPWLFPSWIPHEQVLLLCKRG